MPTSVEQSQKERLFNAILAAGGVKDWPDLKSRLDFFIDPHNATHLLYSLQKEGRLTLREAGNGAGAVIVDIKPTRTMQINPQPEYVVIPASEFKNVLASEGIAMEQLDEGGGRPIRVVHTKGRHPIGKDATDPAQHKAVAIGGPIERSHIQPERVPVKDIPLEPERQNEKARWAINTAKVVIDWAKYPLIDQLQHRNEAVFRASKIMEEAGLLDQAIAIMETVSQSPLEEEVLALVKELK